MTTPRIRLIILAVLAVIVVGLFAHRALLDSAAASAAEHAPEYADRRARVTPDQGLVEIRKAGTDDWIKIENETDVAQGDAVRTGPGAAATFDLYEQGMARLDENSSATLEGLTWDESSQTFTGRIFIGAGRLWSRLLDFMAPESSFQVRTSHLVATVRGTAFSVQASDSAEGVYVAEHLVSVASASDTVSVDVVRGRRLQLDVLPAARRVRQIEPSWKIEDVKDAAKDPWVMGNLERDRAFMERVELKLHGDIERTAPRPALSARIEAKERAALLGGGDRQRVATRGLSRLAAEALLAADRGDMRAAAVLLDRAGRFCVAVKDAGAQCRVHPRVVEFAAHQRHMTPAVLKIMSGVSPDLTDVMRRVLERRATFDEKPEPISEPGVTPDRADTGDAATADGVVSPTPSVPPRPTETAPKPLKLELSAQRYTFGPGESGSFSAYLRWSDGRSEDVTARVVWTLAPSAAGAPLVGQMRENVFAAGYEDGESRLTATYTHDLGIFTAADVVRVTRPSAQPIL